MTELGLKSKQKEIEYFNLNFHRKEALLVYYLNSIAVNKAEDESSALYITISRINHSCSPNVQWSYLEDKKTRKEVRVIRDVRKGEELLVDYITDRESFLLASQRKEILRIGWNFDCRCSLCSIDHVENDALRQRIQKLHEDIPFFGKRQDVVCAANAALQKCKLLEKCEDLKSDLPMAYLELYEILTMIAMHKRFLKIDEALMARVADRREEYREKAYNYCTRTKLVCEEEMHNTKIVRLARMGGSNKLVP